MYAFHRLALAIRICIWLLKINFGLPISKCNIWNIESKIYEVMKLPNHGCYWYGWLGFKLVLISTRAHVYQNAPPEDSSISTITQQRQQSATHLRHQWIFFLALRFFAVQVVIFQKIFFVIKFYLTERHIFFMAISSENKLPVINAILNK